MQSQLPTYIRREVLRLQGVSYSDPHLRTMEAKGLFPKRILLSPRRTVWNQQEITGWIEARKAGLPWSPAPTQDAQP